MHDWQMRTALVGMMVLAGCVGLWTPMEAVADDATIPVPPIVPGFERFFTGEQADAVRGGQLLLGELNCVACHRADAFKDHLLTRQAPVLDAIGTRTTPEYLRSFLRDPRDGKPGTLMPDLFTGLPESERDKQVEALVHFLATTGSVVHAMPDKQSAMRGEVLFHQVGCVACHAPRIVVGSLREPTSADGVGGLQSLATSVPLGELAKKYSVPSLIDVLRDPHKVRPSGRMPNLNLDEKEARDIANYLLDGIEVEPNVKFSYFEGNWQTLPDFIAMKPQASGFASGFDLGVTRRPNEFGLRFEGFLRIDRDGEYTFHLGSDDGSRLVVGGKPVVDVDGVHPYQQKSAKARLSAGMHPIVVDFFQGGGEWVLTVEYEGPGLPRQPVAGAVSVTEEGRKEKAGFVVNPELAAKGRELFASVGCANCHQLKQGDQPIKPQLVAMPLAELEPGKGCVDGGRLAPRADGRSRSERTTIARTIPHFGLSEKQQAALDAVLKIAKQSVAEIATKLAAATPEETIVRTMTAFNCYACHARGNFGGVETARNDYFQTTVKEMGDEGRIPPALDGCGDKLTSNWLTHVLANGANDRPYMLARMPKFGLNHVGRLVQAFETVDAKTEAEKAEFADADYRVKSAGRFLVGDKALSCIKCHNVGQYKATGIQAADLTTMTQRLRKDWFHRYMVNPQQFRPGTRMPSAWPNGRSVVPAVLEGNTPQQLGAIWAYLSDGSKAAVPTGLISNPIELVPKDEPIIYRNFIQGLSARGIAVGYPEKAHLAFDAEQFSLSLVWHGAFIDAAKHWVGRGPGYQTPLGDHVLSLAAGVPFAALESADAAWPTQPAKELGYHFRGYRLDTQRRPIFLYSFGNIQVEDFPKPVPAKPDAFFQRTLTLKATPSAAGTEAVDGLWFRAAAGSKIEPLDDGWYRIDGALQMRIEQADASPPIVRQNGNRFELLAPLRFNANEVRIVQEIVW